MKKAQHRWTMSVRSMLLLSLTSAIGITMILTALVTGNYFQQLKHGNRLERGLDHFSFLHKKIDRDLDQFHVVTDLIEIHVDVAGPLLRKKIDETKQLLKSSLDQFEKEFTLEYQELDPVAFEGAREHFSSFQDEIVLYLYAYDLYLDASEGIDVQTLMQMSDQVVEKSATFDSSMATYTDRGRERIQEELKSTMWTLSLLALLALTMIVAFGYGVSNAIATPLERLSAASESAHKPGGEFEVEAEELWILEEMVLARAIGALVEARNEEAQDLEEKVSRKDAALAALNGMDQLGVIAGNVAHDFSNLLTIIIGYAEVSLKKPELTEDLHKNLEQIFNAAQLGKGVTEQLLKLSRRSLDPSRPGSVALPRFIEEMEPLWEPLLGPGIDMTVRSHGAISEIAVEEHIISQIVMNLVTNSRDAMPDGGKIEILVENASSFDAASIPDALDPAHHYSVIEVSDEGTGIPREMVEKLFQPYETSKERGLGNGLGLAIVHNMVRAAGGWIDFTTKQGVGTTFKVWLPQVSKPSSESSKIPSLLLIEDEEMIREIIEQALLDEGYKVTSASNGLLALEEHEHQLSHFDAVISDIRMPGMDGDKVVERFRNRRRALPVLFISGNQVMTENPSATCPTLFLQKPFTADELNDRVRKLLALGQG